MSLTGYGDEEGKDRKQQRVAKWFLLMFEGGEEMVHAVFLLF